MSNDTLIPVKKELSFVAKTVFVMITSTAASLAILYFFLSKSVSSDYKSAFQMLAATYDKLNVYIIIAILVQLVFSMILIYMLALLYSHKIAGPVYRLKMVLQDYMAGKAPQSVGFRQSDFITAVSTWFTDYFSFLRKRQRLLTEGETLLQQYPHQNVPEKEACLRRLNEIVAELEG